MVICHSPSVGGCQERQEGRGHWRTEEEECGLSPASHGSPGLRVNDRVHQVEEGEGGKGHPWEEVNWHTKCLCFEQAPRPFFGQSLCCSTQNSSTGHRFTTAAAVVSYHHTTYRSSGSGGAAVDARPPGTRPACELPVHEGPSAPRPSQLQPALRRLRRTHPPTSQTPTAALHHAMGGHVQPWPTYTTHTPLPGLTLAGGRQGQKGVLPAWDAVVACAIRQAQAGP